VTSEEYGVSRVCRALEIPRSSFYHRKSSSSEQKEKRQKPGPKSNYSDELVLEKIKEILEESIWTGEGHRKIWRKLRTQKKLYISKARTLRIMRENRLLAVVPKGKSRPKREHNGTIIPEAPNQMWGTDMTTTLTFHEGQASIFFAIDHYTAECVGIHAAKNGTRFEALEPIRQGVSEYCLGFEKDGASGLSLRHDHGSQYTSHAFQEEIRFPGIQSSPSFVRQPETNGCAERFVRTLKEQLLWLKDFYTVEELRVALQKFKEDYNREWMIERHEHRSPSQARIDFYGCQQMAA
jgi:transposase InsO family protein